MGTIIELPEELRLDDGTRQISPVPGAPNGFLVEGARYFTFHLCRKPAVLGDLKMDQWWMDRRTLYPDRGREAVNHEVTVEYWWSLCTKVGTVSEDSIQETYILAKLLPHARSNGARRVFGDAVPTERSIEGRSGRQAMAELDQMLANGRNEELNKLEFYRKTADCLGPPEFEPEVVEAHQRMTAEYFEQARAALQRWGKNGLVIAQQEWLQLMNSIGRRRGNKVRKRVLDILSYECRAAFHQCYSAVWCELLRHLAGKYGMDERSMAFHCLWHLDQREPSNMVGYDLHLFHGHVFALHSATGRFLNTKTGGELMAAWLKERDDGPAFRRLLYGLLVAIHHYASRNQSYALLRKESPKFFTDEVLQQIEQSSGKRGKRRSRPPSQG